MLLHYKQIFWFLLTVAMESSSVIVRVVSHDDKTSETTEGSSYLWIRDQRSVDEPCATTESVRPIDVSERDEQKNRKLNLRSYDCDSHAKATTVSQIDKGYSVGTVGQPTLDDTDAQQARYCKQPGPLDSIHQEYYINPKLCKKERRMSSLSMGSARASRRERYLSVEEQYEMLKLHHLNLLNEIHETALMLNLFEQRQLLREQQQKMRQIQNLQLDNSESSRYFHDRENHEPKGPSNISDDEEQDLKCGKNVNITSSINKRYMEEIQEANKRRK